MRFEEVLFKSFSMYCTEYQEDWRKSSPYIVEIWYKRLTTKQYRSTLLLLLLLFLIDLTYILYVLYISLENLICILQSLLFSLMSMRSKRKPLSFFFNNHSTPCNKLFPVANTPNMILVSHYNSFPLGKAFPSRFFLLSNKFLIWLKKIEFSLQLQIASLWYCSCRSKCIWVDQYWILVRSG